MHSKNNTIKIISKFGNRYKYYPNTNLLLNDNESAVSQQSLKGIEQYSASLSQSDLRIEKVTAHSIKSAIYENSLSELVIEVTTKCNLRCKYCIFGEDYDELRKHGLRNIEFDTAKEAIDIYFDAVKEAKIYNPNRVPFLSFYGGEPLLNFPVIKKCIEYVKTIYKDKVSLTLTTNGTLLTDEMIHYFKENDLMLIFSLDGPKAEHDKHRVTESGHGSFDVVIKNIEKAAMIYKRPMFVIAVIDIDTKVREVITYFASNPNLLCISLSAVSHVNTTYFDRYTPAQFESRAKAIEELREEYYEMVKKGTDRSNRYLALLDLLFAGRCLPILMRTILTVDVNKTIPYTSTCLPADRVFCDIDGVFHMCEKLSRTRDIGSIKEGINYQKIADIVNEYNTNICNKCKNCQTRALCPSCFNNFLLDGKFQSNHEICASLKEGTISGLQEFVSINEINPSWLDEFRNNYYSQIQEIAEVLK